MNPNPRSAAAVALVGAGLAALGACAGSARPPAVSTNSTAVTTMAVSQPSTSGPVRSTGRFALWSELDVNLHHFLHYWARSLTDRGRRLTIPERDDLGRLSESDRLAWTAAVEHYREHLGLEDPIFDRDLTEVRDVAAGTLERARHPRSIAALEVLDSVREIYAKSWWPEHDRANRAWIDAVAPVVASLEPDVVERVESVYRVGWPRERLRIDVSAYAGDLGAYTNRLGRRGGDGSWPPHITISSTDAGNVLPQGAEIVFHESLHSDRMEGAMRKALAAAFGERKPPRRFWHRLLFYNAGEAVREAFAAVGEPGYATYSERYGLWSRSPSAARAYEVLARHWQPFLDGQRSREEALTKIAADLAAAAES